MYKISNIKVYLHQDLKEAICLKLNINNSDISNITILKKSIDARKKDDIHYLYTVSASLIKNISHKDVSDYIPVPDIKVKPSFCKFRPIVVGSGPAGMFAALILAKAGQNPIVIERGKDVKRRLFDIKLFNEKSILNTESNVQFGEGGAGTFSDGKLNTGIKSPYIKYVLKTFAECGAPENILYDSRPHIGSDKLMQVIPNLRRKICSYGGEFMFDTRLCDIKSKSGKVYAIATQNNEIETDRIFLATGHSARDIFELLYKKGITMVAKPFAIGARIEHLQEDINYAQYAESAALLPPADYRFAVHLENGFSAYTFCMCPGGFVSASASEENSIVTNGYSNFKRNGKNANSALLVGITPDSDNPLEGMYLQRDIERNAFKVAGMTYKAPCQRVEDFLNHIPSTQTGTVAPTYPCGVTLGSIDDCLPSFITNTMRQAIPLINRKMPGFACPDALLTAPETRSSSPVRIIRNQNGVSSLDGLYPIGEGSGYAGGIMSSAVDGIKSALLSL